MSLFGTERVSELNRFWREMAPVSGRMEGTLRFALASALATLLLLVLQGAISFFAPSLFMLFLVSHDSPYQCAKDLFTCISFAAVGTTAALLLVIATGNDPVARVLGIGVFTFLATFFFRACTMPLAPLSFGCLAYMTISLWEKNLRAEKILHLSLWPIGTLAIVAVSGIAVDYLFNRSDPLLTLRREIKTRWAALERLFQLHTSCAHVKRIEAQSAVLRRYAVTGEGQLQVLMERVVTSKSCAPSECERLRTVILALDRLLALGASVSSHIDFEGVNPAKLQRIAAAIAAAREGQLESVNDLLGSPQAPLSLELDGIERSLRHLADSVPSPKLATEAPHGSSSSRCPNSSLKRLLLPDAFTNYDYFIYALKLSVCATICYVLYNALKWPGIGTAIYFTVYFTGLSTTGASNRKILFRVIGSAIGGMILGIACLVFVFPNIEGVTGFLLIISALALLGAWIGCSPYFGYIGLQITYAFNLLAFERFSTPDQMTPARDRLLGIALGFLVMLFIFHQVRPERTVDTMRRLLARLLRSHAEVTCLLNMESDEATAVKIAEVGKRITATVTNLEAFADVIRFEFPPDRAADMRLSSELLNVVTNAADLMISVRAWPQDGDQRSAGFKELRSTFENGLLDLARSLEEFVEVQPYPAQQLERALEGWSGTVPTWASKAIDSYRELQAACNSIVRLAA